jgi:hypothetical protein
VDKTLLVLLAEAWKTGDLAGIQASRLLLQRREEQAMQYFTGSLWIDKHVLTTVEGKIELASGPGGKLTCRGKFIQMANITAAIGARYRLEVHGGPTLDIDVTARSNGGPLQETWFDFESVP